MRIYGQKDELKSIFNPRKTAIIEDRAGLIKGTSEWFWSLSGSRDILASASSILFKSVSYEFPV